MEGFDRLGEAFEDVLSGFDGELPFGFFAEFALPAVDGSNWGDSDAGSEVFADDRFA